MPIKPKLRPSSLPMLKQCACFIGKPSEHTSAGTERHEALSDLLASDDTLWRMLPEDEKEGVRWASDYIQIHRDPKSPIQSEQQITQKIQLINQVTVEMTGTPDIVSGNQIFDLKWRWRDYRPQMAAYALLVFPTLPAATEFISVHVLFAEAQRVTVHTFTREQALAIVEPIASAWFWFDQQKPTPCDYCDWCAEAHRCPALLPKAIEMGAGYGGDEAVKLVQWHPSKVETAEEMGQLLTFWRKFVKKCGESIEYHAKEMALRGTKIPGYTLEEDQGDQYVADVEKAWALAQLPQAEFMKCCSIRLNTSKTYPDRVGLFDAYAKARSMTKAGATRQLTNQLGDALARGKSSFTLKAEKTTTKEVKDNGNV